MPRRQQRAAAQSQGGAEVAQRKTSTGSATLRSEGLPGHYGKAGIRQVPDGSAGLPEAQRDGGHVTRGGGEGSGPTRFPKLEECAHFHYDFVDFGPLQVALCEDERENYRHKEAEKGETMVVVRVSCNGKAWTVHRSLAHFCSLDGQLHRCIFDRRFSHLPELLDSSLQDQKTQEVEELLQSYLCRLSELAGPMVNCGSILNWLEMDNRGNRLVALDNSGINTPAFAAAHAVKSYTAHAADEISLQVGDMVSLIDMRSQEETKWWRGKRGYEVGFFPSECVEVIGDKVPPSMATAVPMATGTLGVSPGSSGGGSGSSGSSATMPLTTAAAARKPCETTENVEDTASMVRKHGKLMSFLRTFFSTRPPRNQLKQSGIVKERVFGCDLGEHLLNSGHDVPVVLKCCTEVIERYGIVDGIYRLSGVTSNIQRLRVAFDEDEAPDLTESVPYLQDIHSISSLLKMYFRELPNPLLTYQLYHQFAEAVKDEGNRLLGIYDVVQQLPPPHYRTLEYLMRHLARVASQGSQTGMHSKNLAIVWAPNLLRSKALEQGGGAAALQGVGIQAVVTECLICYCDLIFGDTSPDADSPQSQKAEKKPRPRSLAISSPTRLLSLEEARERAFSTSVTPAHRFIDVGGGAAALPTAYHTVIDLPAHRKRNLKDANKGKKSPSTGWKSIFSKPRAASVRKVRKGSVQEEDKSLATLPSRALTDDDMPTWTRRLRSAKSAESLVSPGSSVDGSIGTQNSTSSVAYTNGSRGREEFRTVSHQRSLSSDGSSFPRRPSSPALESLVSPLLRSGGGQKASKENAEPSSPGSHRSRRTERRTDRRQSFVRGDTTRRAVHHHHRRTPSAPNTPRRERQLPTEDVRQLKASSQPHLDSLTATPDLEKSWAYTSVDAELGIDIDAAINARLQQMAVPPPHTSPQREEGRGERERGSSGRERERSPLGREGGSERGLTEEVLKLQSSPGSHRRSYPPSSPLEHTGFFTSRYHDYAEIESEEEEETRRAVQPAKKTQNEMKTSGSKSSLSSDVFLPPSQGTPPPVMPTTHGLTKGRPMSQPASDVKPKTSEVGITDRTTRQRPEKATQVAQRSVERVLARGGRDSAGSIPNTQVTRRRAEWIPSDVAPSSSEHAGTGTRWTLRGREVQDFPPLIPAEAVSPPSAHRILRQHSPPSTQPNSMNQSSSLPSGVVQSQEKFDSQPTDSVSPVTRGTPSKSVSGAQELLPSAEDARWRSASSVGPERDGPRGDVQGAASGETDSEFFHKVEHALRLEKEGYSRHERASAATTTTTFAHPLIPAMLDSHEDCLSAAAIGQAAVTIHSTPPTAAQTVPSSAFASTPNLLISGPFETATPSFFRAASPSAQEAAPTVLQETHFPTTPDEVCSVGTGAVSGDRGKGPNKERDGIPDRELTQGRGTHFGSPHELIGLPHPSTMDPSHAVPDYAEPCNPQPPQPSFVPVAFVDPDYAVIEDPYHLPKLPGQERSLCDPDYAEVHAPSQPLPVSMEGCTVREPPKEIPEYAVVVKNRTKTPAAVGGQQAAIGPVLDGDSVTVITTCASSLIASDGVLATVVSSSTATAPTVVSSVPPWRHDDSAMMQTNWTLRDPSLKGPEGSDARVQLVRRRQLNSSSSSSSSSTGSTMSLNMDEQDVGGPTHLDAHIPSHLHTDIPSHSFTDVPTQPHTNVPSAQHTDTTPHPPTDIPSALSVYAAAEVPEDLRQFSPHDILWRQTPCGEGPANPSANIGHQHELSSDSQRVLQDIQSRPVPEQASADGMPSVIPQGPWEGPAMLASSGWRNPALNPPPVTELAPCMTGSDVGDWVPHDGGYSSCPASQRSPLAPAELSVQTDSGLKSSLLTCDPAPAPPQSLTSVPHAFPPAGESPAYSISHNPPLLASGGAAISPHPTPSTALHSPQSSGPPYHPASQGPDAEIPQPVHLTLYHPDEFLVPPAAIGMATGSAPLQQVDISEEVRDEMAEISEGGRSGRWGQLSGGGDAVPCTGEAAANIDTAESICSDVGRTAGKELPRTNPVSTSFHAYTDLPTSTEVAEVRGAQPTPTPTTAAVTTTSTDAAACAQTPHRASHEKVRGEDIVRAAQIPQLGAASVVSLSKVAHFSCDRSGGPEPPTEAADMRPRESDEQSKTLVPMSSDVLGVSSCDLRGFVYSLGESSASAVSGPDPAMSESPKALSCGQTPPCPTPRTRISLQRSHHIGPPVQEVLEIARPSVKRRTSVRREQGADPQSQTDTHTATHRTRVDNMSQRDFGSYEDGARSELPSVQKWVKEGELPPPPPPLTSVNSEYAAALEMAVWTDAPEPEAQTGSALDCDGQRTGMQRELGAELDAAGTESSAGRMDRLFGLQEQDPMNHFVDMPPPMPPYDCPPADEAWVEDHWQSEPAHLRPDKREHSDQEKSTQKYPRQRLSGQELSEEVCSIQSLSKQEQSNRGCPAQFLSQQEFFKHELSGQDGSTQTLSVHELSRQKLCSQQPSPTREDSLRSNQPIEPDQDAMLVIEGREFPPPSPPLPAPPSPLQEAHGERESSHLTTGQLSLDDSALQQAAQRFEDLVPSGEKGEGGGYSTGSLRARHSHKMRHLMGMFERGEDEATGEADSTPSSGLPVGSDGAECISHSFPPPACMASLPASRSEMGERGGGAGASLCPSTPPIGSTSAEDGVANSSSSLLLGRGAEHPWCGTDPVSSVTPQSGSEGRVDIVSRPERGVAPCSDACQSPACMPPPMAGGVPQGPARQEDRGSMGKEVEEAKNEGRGDLFTSDALRKRGGEQKVGNTLPCRDTDMNVSNQQEADIVVPSGKMEREATKDLKPKEEIVVSKTRTVLETAPGNDQDDTSRSAGDKKADKNDTVTQAPKMRTSEKHTEEEKQDDGSNVAHKVHRQESIKELRALFETSPQDGGKDSRNDLALSVPQRRSMRVRSASPEVDKVPAPAVPSAERRSMEIPRSWSALKQRSPEPHLTTQRLRLGPKPFYGAPK